jgi:hypothetical protein
MGKTSKISIMSFKGILYLCLSVICLSILSGVILWSWMKWEHHLPSEQQVRQQFENHRADYIRFAALLRSDSTARYVGSNGDVNPERTDERNVAEYRNLAQKIGVKCVIIGEDGSMEFELGGYGGAIISDSYMGVYYSPMDSKMGSRSGWTPKVVTSLTGAMLPQENGQVATGLYVVEVEPEWYIYRYEYQE